MFFLLMEKALPAPKTRKHAKALAPKLPCLECGGPITSRKQNFCSDAHKRTYHNRNGGRGQMIVPLAMAMRYLERYGDFAPPDEIPTRDEALRIAARSALFALLDEYIEGDLAAGYDPSEGARRKLLRSGGAPRIKGEEG